MTPQWTQRHAYVDSHPTLDTLCSPLAHAHLILGLSDVSYCGVVASSLLTLPKQPERAKKMRMMSGINHAAFVRGAVQQPYQEDASVHQAGTKHRERERICVGK